MFFVPENGRRAGGVLRKTIREGNEGNEEGFNVFFCRLGVFGADAFARLAVRWLELVIAGTCGNVDW